MPTMYYVRTKAMCPGDNKDECWSNMSALGTTETTQGLLNIKKLPQGSHGACL